MAGPKNTVTRNDLARLAQLRLEHGLTYKALAAYVGLHPSSLFRILQRGHSTPLLATTSFRIARFLDAAATGKLPALPMSPEPVAAPAPQDF